MTRPIPAAYGDVLDRGCPTCGAEPGEFCIVADVLRGERVRRVPCVRRCSPAPASEPPASSPAERARSFSEPIHQLDDLEEETR